MSQASRDREKKRLEQQAKEAAESAKPSPSSSRAANSSPETPMPKPTRYADHKEAKEALAAGGLIGFSIFAWAQDTEDQMRAAVLFRDKNGAVCEHYTMPFKGATYQAMVEDAARKLLRLSKRSAVEPFLRKQFTASSLDWAKIFQVQIRKPKAEILHTWSQFLALPAGRFPAIVAKVEAAIKADGFYLEKRRGRPTIKVVPDPSGATS